MLLAEAIRTSSTFTSKGKEAPVILRALRLIPSYQGQPARLYATNGVTGIIVNVGQELPNMVLPVDPLVKVRRDVIAIRSVEDTGNAVAAITVVGKQSKEPATYTLEGLAPSDFPGFPAIPDKFTKLTPYQWQTIQKIVHAAGKDPTKPELMNIRFRPTAVETTDRSRVARAEVPGPWSGLVPAELFKQWPKAADVEVAFTDYHCFWRINGQELRFAVIQRSEKYPALDKIIPEDHAGWWMNLETKAFAETVKKASDMSPTKSVVLDFGIMGLTVRAHTREGPDFEGKLNAPLGIPDGHCAQYTTLLVNGKMLGETLKVVDTPKVKVCYGKPDEPLRLESAGLIECIWPMLTSTCGVSDGSRSSS